jgi:hypothetical protein
MLELEEHASEASNVTSKVALTPVSLPTLRAKGQLRVSLDVSAYFGTT